jgi:hypothetical protein
MTRRDFAAVFIVWPSSMWLGNHIQNRRMSDFADGRIMLAEWERQHLHECDGCQKIASTFISTRPPSTLEESLAAI